MTLSAETGAAEARRELAPDTRPDDGPDAGLQVVRDAEGRAAALLGDGVAHHRADGDDGWTTVDDPAGATSLRQDEDRTELLRDGRLLARYRHREAEEWVVPGTPGRLRVERDPDGEVARILLGETVLAARADGEDTRVLRWASAGRVHADVGSDAAGLFLTGARGERRIWRALRDRDVLALGGDTYRFDAEGRVVAHEHPALGTTRYVFAGRHLAAVETPTDRVELHHGPDGRVRTRRDAEGRTTYGYDAEGRRVRESGPSRTRRLTWDALDRLVAVTDADPVTGAVVAEVRYVHDGFGRRVRREVARHGVATGVTFEHRDLQGRLWAVTDADGRPLRTWLWDGHRCLAAFDGPAGTVPAAVYATAPSGVPVGFADAAGRVHDLPATPYGEDRPAGHPALWFHLADEHTGYVHVTQRDADPATWQFLSPDPYHGQDDDRRRLLGVEGPLARERDDRTTPYALCGFDPVRRVDPNGAVSAGTVLWQLFGGLTWHLPAHTINWLWIHPFVNFSFATILAWVPAVGIDPRGAFDSWWEFWVPSNYSWEESARQDIGAELMAGWMSANRTFTFQNAIWGRKKTWDPLDDVASLEPAVDAPYAQRRFGSLVRISRGDGRTADALDSWAMVADGVDAAVVGNRQYSIAGGSAHDPVLGGRERVITQGNLHVFRQVRSAGVNVPGTDPAQPRRSPVAMHSRATRVQECAPGGACAQVTLRTAGRIFTYAGTDALTVDGDVVRLGGVLVVVSAVQVKGANTDLEVLAGNAGTTLPGPGSYTGQWATRDAAGAQSLPAHPAGPDHLQLPDTTVGWTPGSIAKLTTTPAVVALAPVDVVESFLPVTAQAALPAGGVVTPLGAPVPVAATLDPDQRLRVAVGAVGQGVVLRLQRGGGTALARVTLVTNDAANPAQDLLTLDSTPAALGLPGAGDPTVAVLATQPRRGTLISAVPAGAGTAAVSIAVNTALGANVVGIDVAGALAVLTGAETRAIHLSPNNPIGGAGPWNVERFTFPAGARTHAGTLSGPLEIAQFDSGDPVSAISTEALLRLRSVTVPAPVPGVAALVRVSDRELARPSADPSVAAGDLLAVAGATTAVVCVADVAVSVTLDRVAGAQGARIDRVCRLTPGERAYDAVRVDGTVRLVGTALGAPALLPDWVAGDIVQVTVTGSSAQEWVLAADLDGGRLVLRDGPAAAAGVLPGAAGATARVSRLVPAWPPLARGETEPGRTSEVLAPAAAGPSRHRWVSQTANVPTGNAVGLVTGGTVFAVRVASVDAQSARTTTLPAGPLAGYARVAGAGATDRIVARWEVLGDELRLKDQLAPTPGGGAVVVLDALAPVQDVAVTPKPQALMLPAEPENDTWILTARQSLREHELRHALQASMWGPMFLGFPLGAAGDAIWDLRGGSGRFEVSPYEAIEAVPETTGERPRPAGFRLTAPTGQFRLAPGEVVEFDLGGKAWRTVITAIDGEAAGGALFWVQNQPPDGLAETGAKARTVSHTDPVGKSWLGIFRVLDWFTNAHLMEFTSGLVWEGLIGLFWRIGRGFSFYTSDKAEVSVTDAGRVTLHAADAAALAKLRLDVGSEVTLDSDAAKDDSYRTVVTGLLGADVTVRDAVPAYPASAKLRLWRGRDKDPDDFWDLRTYRAASLVAGPRNVVAVPGERFEALDVLAVKWTGATGTPHSLEARITVVVGGDPPEYQLDREIDLDGADPDTLRVSRLRNADDPALAWKDTAFYETPIRIRRVTRYLFDPWRTLTLDTDFVRPADGSTFKTVLAWIARSVRYVVSNRSWVPGLGYVVWQQIGGAHTHKLEQQASWNSGDLYSTLTRSGDPRFAASEGGYGEEPGSYGVFEGELLRMWMWDTWRWNDVFASFENGATIVAAGGAGARAANQNPSLASAAAVVTPWDDRWRFTAPAGLIAGLEYPAEIAQNAAGGGATPTFRPTPLLQIPTRRDVSRNSGVYFVACQAGAWQVGPTVPGGNDLQAQAASAQFHTRTVQVQPLAVTAGGTPLPWQAPAAPAALTLFLTQQLAVDVGGGNGGTYRLRVLDEAAGTVVWQTDALTLRARLTPGVTETVEVVRVYEPNDPYLARFGTYLAQQLAIPVRRFGVTVSSAITLRNGTDPASPQAGPTAGPGTPVRPGATVSAFLPVTTSVLPTVTYAAPPPGGTPLPVVTGPLPAGNLNRYQIAVSGQAPEQTVQLQVTFTFADPHPAAPPGTTLPVVQAFDVQPAATLAGPGSVAAGTSVTLTVTPADGSAVVAADVSVPAGAGTPAPGVTVVVNATGGVNVTAAVGTAGTAFPVDVLWKGQPARRSMTVT